MHMLLRDSAFFCTFCEFKTTLVARHLQHRLLHRHVNRNVFHCGFDHCQSALNSEAALRMHVLRHHKRSQVKCDSAQTTSDDHGRFLCSLQFCQRRLHSHSELMKHLKVHMKLGIATPCPFPSCHKKYSSVQTFSGHCSKYHASCCLLPETEHCPALNFQNELEHMEPLVNNTFCDEMEINLHEEDSCLSEEETFLVTMSQFYMKLEFELFLPVSTVQYIVTELSILQTQNEHLMKQRFKKKLQEDGIPNERIDNIVNYVYNNNPIASAQSKLKSDYFRKGVYKTKFDYVEPLKLPLPPKGNGKPRFFYYVPVKETVKKMFKNRSINVSTSAPNFSKVDGLLLDYVDGTVFQNNQFFIKNPSGLHLVLYQDAFELVVPIGPAKKKHKMLAVYLMIGNLPLHLRSHVNSIQLVALCLEKDFDHDAVYGSIVQELKILETEGVFIEQNGIVKGSLVCIVGDNLGSHGAGGFVENFSKSTYFCRFCHVTRAEFFSPDGECLEHTPRTVASYKNSLAKLAAGRQKVFHGIKFNSVFNDLKYFHVCLPGLSPCLAHDCFEGLVAFDVKLFLDYFVENNWFTYESLTAAVAKFPFSPEDSRDKPIPVLSSYERVKGGAWQVWVFLRLFPLIVKDFVLDKHDEVWKTLLGLLEIIEIIVAPVIHESYLPYLKTCITSYLSSRRDLFPLVELRPKHHYLSHYPELIKCFGPLMRVFTLRFESKHQFFKRAIRSSKNFINPLKSLAVRHELFQAFVRTGADFRCEIEVFGDTEFILSNYNEKLQHAVLEFNLNQCRECVRVVVKGTSYQKGNVVVVRQSGYQYQVELGSIVLIIFDNHDKVYFLVEKNKSTFLPHLRAYELQPTLSYECVFVDNLVSYQSLYVYKINGSKYVKLRQAVVSDKLE